MSRGYNKEECAEGMCNHEGCPERKPFAAEPTPTSEGGLDAGRKSLMDKWEARNRSNNQMKNELEYKGKKYKYNLARLKYIADYGDELPNGIMLMLLDQSLDSYAVPLHPDPQPLPVQHTISHSPDHGSHYSHSSHSHSHDYGGGHSSYDSGGSSGGSDGGGGGGGGGD